MPEDKTTEEQTTAATETTETQEPETKTEDASAAAADDSTQQTPTTETDSSSEASSDQNTETQDTAGTKDTNDSEATAPAARVIPEVADYKLPEGTPQLVAEFAHENDMTQEQLDATLTKFAEFNAMAEQGKQLEIKKSGERLVNSWGKDKNYKLSIVQRALKQIDTEGQLSELLNVSGYGNHPAVLNFLLSVGNSMKEGGFLNGSVNTPGGTVTAAQAMFGEKHPTKQ